MTRAGLAQHPRGPQVLAAALTALLVGQAAELGHLRRASVAPPAQCGRATPAPAPELGLDVQVQLPPALVTGRRTAGRLAVVNRGREAVLLRSTQAVLLEPAAFVPLSPPEAPRRVGRLLAPGEFLTLDLVLDLRSCPGTALRPGFVEVAVVLELETSGRRRVLSSRKATALRSSNMVR